MEIRQLESLFWIATLGSFSAAARRMNTTQPSVSARIQGLEHELGIILFDRNATPVRLTPRGIEIFDHARQVLEELDRIRLLAVSESRVTGLVRLGVASVIAHTWLPDAIRHLNERHPGVEIEIMVGNAPTLRRRLAANELDLIASIEAIELPETKSRYLCSHRLDWMASPLLDIGEGPLSPADLATYRVITFTRRTATHNAVQQFLTAGGLGPVRLTRSNSSAMVIELAERGLGICALPAILAKRSLDDGKLRLLQVTPSLPNLEFFVTHRTGPLQELAQLMADVMIEVASATADPPPA